MVQTFVSRIKRLSKTRVTFQNGRALKLPSNSPAARDLRFAARARRPVLVHSAATGVLISASPVWISGVNRTRRSERGLIVNLRGRTSALLLPANHERFKELAALLTNAVGAKRVLAVAQRTGTKLIIDAVPSRGEHLSGERTEYRKAPPLVRIAPTTRNLVEAAIAPLIRRQCAPRRNVHISTNSSCVPFKYAFEGCNGRASAMCAALGKAGIASGKVFSIASANSDLVVRTANEPCGTVYWDHHVACVVNVGGVQLVIDPSLSEKKWLMTIKEWTSLMSGKQVTRVTNASVYGLEPVGPDKWRVHFDTRDARASAELADARATFSELVDENGAPPYSRPLFGC
jgi:hypothetical protein